MGIKTTCPTCHKTMLLKTSVGGKSIRCPKCGAVFRTPTSKESQDEDNGDSCAESSEIRMITQCACDDGKEVAGLKVGAVNGQLVLTGRELQFWKRNVVQNLIFGRLSQFVSDGQLSVTIPLKNLATVAIQTTTSLGISQHKLTINAVPGVRYEFFGVSASGYLWGGVVRGTSGGLNWIRDWNGFVSAINDILMVFHSCTLAQTTENLWRVDSFETSPVAPDGIRDAKKRLSALKNKVPSQETSSDVSAIMMVIWVVLSVLTVFAMLIATGVLR